MPITNGYATLTELKERLGFDFDDSEDDAKLENVITAASRWIDWKKKTRFFASTETRYYTPKFGEWLIVDDLLSVTTLKSDEDGDGTFEITWTTGDYHLMPLNAALENRPYTDIKTTPDGDYTFPVDVLKSVQIVGSFGYVATTPPNIKEACLLASIRLFKRKDIPFGISGNADLGTLEVVAQLGRDDEIKMALDATYERLI